MFLRNVVLKICSKFTGKHPCRSVILNFASIFWNFFFLPSLLVYFRFILCFITRLLSIFPYLPLFAGLLNLLIDFVFQKFFSRRIYESLKKYFHELIPSETSAGMTFRVVLFGAKLFLFHLFIQLYYCQTIYSHIFLDSLVWICIEMNLTKTLGDKLQRFTQIHVSENGNFK